MSPPRTGYPAGYPWRRRPSSQEDPVPTYAYACTECDHRFEVVQSFTDDALTVCPACGGRLRKVFNAVGIVFKGGGFYRTDSRSGSSLAAASSDGGSSGGSSNGSGSDAGAPAASGSSGSSGSSTSASSTGAGSSASSSTASA